MAVFAALGNDRGQREHAAAVAGVAGRVSVAVTALAVAALVVVAADFP